jgi:hypothetical protein
MPPHRFAPKNSRSSRAASPSRMPEEADAVLDRAALGIGCAEIHPPDAGESDRGRAHRAGFERHVEVAARQALVLEHLAGPADREHFGMGGGIAQLARAVAGGRDDLALGHDHGSDRHLAARRGRARLVQSEAHRIAFRGACVIHSSHPRPSSGISPT